MGQCQGAGGWVRTLAIKRGPVESHFILRSSAEATNYNASSVE